MFQGEPLLVGLQLRLRAREGLRHPGAYASFGVGWDDARMSFSDRT